MDLSSREGLRSTFSWASYPLICNAPMYGPTNAELATQVTTSGGLGFIGGGADFSTSSTDLAQLSSQLTQARELLGVPKDNALPIGVSCLTMRSDTWVANFAELIAQHRPVVVWLFANARRSQHQDLIKALHAAGEEWGLKVIVQIGNLTSAQEAVEDGADMLSVQGSDAGGHQFKDGASLITLLPDVVDMLEEKFPDRNVPLLAAGGIMDGRGIAAALALGANGVVMGTRFLATKESRTSDEKKAQLVLTEDGASSTAKSRIHDQLQGRDDFWPAQYSGRAIITDAYNAVDSGIQPPNVSPSIVTWAGAGIGQVRTIPSAASVVAVSQNQTRTTIERTWRDMDLGDMS
ncbi:putative 2-nitropropane dioxygenase family oxidoreductase [Aspergillus sclerotiicarbonarius CBS 121057]|uniref:Putative 2-nitropropane dioxygenase family oxidoreductase n=1 Tax=Aspergillus sclerotiicarbonarius (strain CBS 121057 / IBT 28362) TaxID=1448318 RepID=A0A319E238_ASPSB|nr:putative 2-nitropropane dioxygenase family oxidoreductase [Aspergillus sclerotiicarbonarius CBS 121057]